MSSCNDEWFGRTCIHLVGEIFIDKTLFTSRSNSSLSWALSHQNWRVNTKIKLKATTKNILDAKTR